jgi:hypothetical protein
MLNARMDGGYQNAFPMSGMDALKIFIVNFNGLGLSKPLISYNMLKVFQIALVLGLLCSCTRGTDLTLENQTLKIDLDKGSNGNFSEFIGHMDYFLVKTDSPSILVSPYKVVMNDSIYFIGDSFQKKVFKYNKHNGAYNMIGKSGEGPNENLELDDFSINQKGIITYDSKLKKFLKYNLKGEFLEEKKSSFQKLVFYQGDNFKLIYSHNDPDLGSRILYVSDDEEIKGFIPIENWFAKKLTLDQNGFVYNKKLKQIFFLLPYTNEIVIFNEKGELIKIVKLDFGKYNFDKESWQKYDDFNSQINYAIENKLVFQVNSFLVLDNYYVLSVNQEGGKSHLIILDHDFNLIRHFNGLNNDLDNVKLSAIPWSGYNNKFLFMINSKRFINENEFLIEQREQKIKSNITSFMELNGEELFKDEYQVFVEVSLK